MSQGKGLGLADMLVQQLTRNRAASSAAAPRARPAAATPECRGPSVPRRTATRLARPAPRQWRRRRIASASSDAGAVRAAGAGAAGRLPDTLIAQAALETGWGQHVPHRAAAARATIFRHQGGRGWSGAAVTAATTEYGAAATAAHQRATAIPRLQLRAAGRQRLCHAAAAQLALQPRSAPEMMCMPLPARCSAAATPPIPDYVQKLQATVASVRALARRSGAAAPLKNPAPPPTTATGEVS